VRLLDGQNDATFRQDGAIYFASGEATSISTDVDLTMLLVGEEACQTTNTLEPVMATSGCTELSSLVEKVTAGEKCLPLSIEALPRISDFVLPFAEWDQTTATRPRSDIKAGSFETPATSERSSTLPKWPCLSPTT